MIQITEAKGWQESAYLKWAPFEGASSYNVYVDDKKIDAQLIRQYASYYRADVLGLKEGTYSVKVVPVNAEGTEIAGANTASNLVVKSYNREGFAHFKYDGVGAYNNDGTLKAGAKVLYITAKTAKTVSTTVNTGKPETITGLQSIIDAYSKGKDKTPIAFRFIGKVSLSDLDHISSSAEGLQIKGAEMNMTFEGVGDDATVYGFGFLLREAVSVEFRNFAIMRCLDDAMSLDTDNSHVWIHNMDLFYGKKGGAADQAKGDGTVDIKADSKYITVAYNRFWDNGKASMCGMKSETGPNYITYHHNWFDHSDSRMARVRTMSVHMYNNYYQHCDVYGIGATMGSSVFMESNYFDATKRPIMSSKQGTDAKGDGTFSGENGGLVKVFGESNATGEGGSTEGGSTGGSTEGGETGGSGSGSGEGGSTGGSTGGTEGGSTVTPIEGTVTCSFATDGTLSNTSFVLTGTKKNVRKENTTIEGVTYSASLKMETGTEVSFTTSQKMTLYVYYGVSGTKTNVKVDGVKQAGAPTTVVLEAGAHKITKNESTTVALIKLVPVTE